MPNLAEQNDQPSAEHLRSRKAKSLEFLNLLVEQARLGLLENVAQLNALHQQFLAENTGRGSDFPLTLTWSQAREETVNNVEHLAALSDDMSQDALYVLIAFELLGEATGGKPAV